jgi:DNA-binding LacI/PurR family transcriptional regulator
VARPAKYQGIADRLRERITAGAFPADAPLPAEGRLAAQFTVNRLTLRKALDLLVREGALVRRHGVGTFVREAATAQASKTLLYLGATREHFFEGFYTALCGAAQDRGKTVLAVTPSREDTACTQVAQQAARYGRLVCVEAEWERLRSVIPDSVHVTVVSGFMSTRSAACQEARPCHRISTDTYRAAKLAVEHLEDLGHRRIAFVDYGNRCCEDRLLGRVRPNSDAYLGYRAALTERGIQAEYAMGLPDPKGGGDCLELNYLSLRHMLDMLPQKPTAFVCVGDFRAGPLLRVLHDLGLRVPDDVSIVGMGDTPWARMLTPALTSVCLGEAEMAQMAVLLSDEPIPARTRMIRVEPELVVRQSTGNAPGMAVSDRAGAGVARDTPGARRAAGPGRVRGLSGLCQAETEVEVHEEQGGH